MFFTHYSNNWEVLLNILSKYLIENYRKKNLNNHLQSFDIIVPNIYISNWLNNEIIKKLGISFNIRFWFMDSYIKNIILKYYKNYDNNIKFILFWRIIYLFLFNKNININIPFIKEINNNNIIKICSNIVDLFLFYYDYFPELIFKWKNNNLYYKNNLNEIWQYKLWKLINNDNICKNVTKNINLYTINKLKKKIKTENQDYNLYIFGIYNLSYLEIKFIEILQISNFNIYIFLNTPSKYFWDFKDNNNFFFLKWGKCINNVIFNLLNFNSIEYNFFIDTTYKINLLSSIQKTILNYEKKIVPRLINYKDDSIYINKCDSKLTEIEILKNQILIFINKNNININDIIIVVNNLSLYLKYIKNIFLNNENIIPINIVNDIYYNFINELFILLDLSKKNCNLFYIINLLNIYKIRKKFNLKLNAIYQIQYWINDISKNIIGFDDNHCINSWEFILDRLLLGYTLDINYNIWNNIIPYNINYESLEILGNFSKFINLLKKWKKKIKKKYFIKDCYKIFIKFIKSFFYFKKIKYKKQLIIITKFLFIFINNNKLNFDKKISLSFFIDLFKEKIINYININNNTNLIKNRLNFIDYNCINGLNYKILYIIGMNYNFPKINYNIYSKYNLSKKYNIYNLQINIFYNFFLQILLNTKYKLYISFVDKNNLGPSKIINELIYYINNNYYIFNKKNKKIKYFYYYEKKNIFINSNLLNKKEKINKIKLKKNKNILLNRLFLIDLLYFWQHPIKYFFNKSLKKYFINYKKKYNYTLMDYKVKSNILNYYIYNKKYKFNYLFKKQMIFDNNKLLWNKLKEEIIFLAEKIILNEKINLIKKQSIYYNFYINKLLIISYISNIYNNTLIEWKPKVLSYIDIFIFYLKHLICCINNINFKYSKIYGLKNTYYVFNNISKNIAKKKLLFYIKGYFLGLNNPLCLIYKTTNLILKYLNKKISKNNILKKIYIILNGNNYIKGEILNDLYLNTYNFYYSLNINKLIFNVYKWIAPIFNNN